MWVIWVRGVHVDEGMWEAVFPLLDAHFLQLVPTHFYEQFLDNVLSSLEVAGHYDANGKALMQYIILFFPKSSMRRFKVNNPSTILDLVRKFFNDILDTVIFAL